MVLYKMRVIKYIPTKLYGFCRGDSGFEVFFHLAVFQPGGEVVAVKCRNCTGPPRCSVGTEGPPPILGEPVEVQAQQGDGSRAPRATSVARVITPRMITGIVESFDSQRRYGFIRGSDEISYHLHESEVLDGRLPLAGRQVVFFPGIREGRPRACHIRVCR